MKERKFEIKYEKCDFIWNDLLDRHIGEQESAKREKKEEKKINKFGIMFIK